ncbi:hypothetical protein ACSBR1_034820 [Camellia fascicularis]
MIGRVEEMGKGVRAWIKLWFSKLGMGCFWAGDWATLHFLQHLLRKHHRRLKIGRLFLQEIGLLRGVENELLELQNKLSTIRAVLLDAEEQQAKNRELCNWLGKLKDAFTDADDLLDEFEIDQLQQQLVNHHSLVTRKVRDFLPSPHSLKFRFSIGHKLKDFNKHLEKIAAVKDQFHLTERFVARNVVPREREMTHSFIRGEDVIGRNDDKEKIIDMLIYNSSNDHRVHCHHEHVSVIPIVGIGGLGKTTLAKLVYNDDKVDQHFHLKMWACVSADLDIEILTRKIITSLTSRSPSKLGIEQLQSTLRSNLYGRKFLLVLDDVWNADHPKWIEFKSLLMDGASGSKIIVTTRSNYVASITGGSHRYDLAGLSWNDCFVLFVKWAFPPGEERKHPNLLKIGEKIVNKCKGVPLAARTFARKLCDKTNEHDWLQMRDSEIWKLEDQKQDDIMPTLRLSYDKLPSYLKQCFAFCSIFLTGQYVYKDELIQLWMAHGLIQSTRNQELEDVGDQYFDELCSRSFFQEVKENGPLHKTFTMHDLVHDLAQSMAQTECITMKFHNQEISSMVRHVSFLGCDYLSGRELPEPVLKLEKLRTIFFPRDGTWCIRDCLVDESISRFLLLRMIDFTDSCFEVLPRSIGYLKHLRYLNLSRNQRIKTLPKSICKLLKLQTLQLSHCKELKQLPKYLGNLVSLRHLYITTRQKFFPEKGIGCLTSLRSLWITGCVNLVSLPDEIQNLTALRTFVINSCPRLASLPSSIGNLTNLQNLMINDCEELDLSKVRGIQGLRIQTVVIGELSKLKALPQWLYGPATSINYLRIVCCPNLVKLPYWPENSTSLQKLEILECPKLSVLPKGFDHLNALKVLCIVECNDNLIRRCQPETGEDWHIIAHVPEIYLNKTKITSAHY